MIPLLLLLQAQPPHDALHYDITLIPSDTSAHVLGEVQITWRLGSNKPVTMELDSAMRVIRVLVDGKPNTRISRTMYARSSTEVEVPHQKQPGDSMSTRVRYRATRGGFRRQARAETEPSRQIAGPRGRTTGFLCRSLPMTRPPLLPHTSTRGLSGGGRWGGGEDRHAGLRAYDVALQPEPANAASK